MAEFEYNALEATQYQEGFNDSYQIAQYFPDLSHSLSHIDGDTPFLEGFKAGKEQFIQDYEMNRYPDWLQSKRFKDREKENDKDKDDLIKE